MYHPQSWLRIIFDFKKGDTLNILWKGMVGVAVYTAALVWLEKNVLHISNSAVIHSLLGFVISLLLVFRTNTAYERWWEGRRQWSNLTAAIRNISFKYNALIKSELVAERTYFYALINNFALALKDYLRDSKSRENYLEHAWLSKEMMNQTEHLPNFLLTQLYKHIVSLRQQELIDPTQMRILDIDVGQLNLIASSCERVRTTPIPHSYRMFLKKFLFVYIFTLPFGFGEQLGYYLAPIVAFVFYVLLSLEILAESIEDPFGTDLEDIPLDDLSKSIRKESSDILNVGCGC